MAEIASGLRRNFQVNTVSFMGILEDEQRKYSNSIKSIKLEIIQRMILTEENWVNTKIKESE